MRLYGEAGQIICAKDADAVVVFTFTRPVEDPITPNFVASQKVVGSQVSLWPTYRDTKFKRKIKLGSISCRSTVTSRHCSSVVFSKQT